MMDAPPPSYPINTITVGDLLIYAQGQQTRATAACSGTVCTFSNGGQSTQIDISDIDPRDTSSAILTNQQTRNGVSIARLRDTVDGLRIDTYGASSAHACRIRCSMNHAVGCDTPMSRCSFMLDTDLSEVRHR